MRETPEWPWVELRRMASVVTTKATEKSFELGLEDIESWTGRLLTAESTYEAAGVAFEKGDVLFGKLRPYLAKVYQAEQRGQAVGDFIVLRPGRNVHSRFLTYNLLEQRLIERLTAGAYGSKMPRTNWDDLGSQPIWLPPFEEQRRIAAFLDHETARIDELVREQEQLINNLVEKKFSLTWNTVTGRDRPDRVSTAVEWLPTIPSDWKLAKLGYLVTCLDSKRIPLNAEERATMPGVIPYWGANGVVDYVAKPLFHERLVLIGEDGAPFFDRTKPVAFVVNEPIWPNNHIHVLRPRDRSAGEAEWLTSVLNVTDYMGFVEGSTRDKLTQGRLMSIPIPVPPARERDRLMARLRSSLIEADDLLKEARHIVDVLLERRSALVSAAVTGQLNLRDWQVPEPEAVAEVA